MKKINPVQKYFYQIASMFKSNIRDYGMYIALVVIFIVFTIMTGGTFLGRVNFTNLLNQTAYVAVLAVGMTLIIVTRDIDLSVGYLGAYLGAFTVVAVERNNTPVALALALALAITIVVGFIKGFLVAKIKVPSFVVTLGATFIFKGMLMNVTQNSTIPATNNFFRKIGIGYLSEGTVFGLNTLTLIIGVLIAILVIVTAIMTRINNEKIGIKNSSMAIFVSKLVFLIALISYLTYTLASYRGISYLLLIAIIVTAVYHFLTTKTVLGRRVYAVGGNPEAAELSGISVQKITMFVFISMGVMALIAGVMFVARQQNASPQHGLSWELYAIAATYIGGTSAKGGVGKVVNSVIGAIVIMALKNGLILAGVSSNIEPIILGLVLVLAVAFDIYTRNVKSVDYVGVYYAKRLNKEEFETAKTEYINTKKDVVAARKNPNISDKELIELEYAYTKALGEYNSVKELISNSKEENFLSMIK